MLRNKILYFMIMAEACLLYTLYNSYETVVLLWIALLLPVFLWLIMLINSFFINVNVIEDRVVVTRKSSDKIEIEVKNKSFLSTGMVRVSGTINEKKFHKDVYISPKSVQKVECPVELEKCGIKEITVSQIAIFDILKIFKRKKKIKKNIQVIVVPNIYGIDMGQVNMEYEYDGESEKFSENSPGDDPSEIFDIRKYVPGDRLSRIHWKLTTKTGKIMVKDFSKPIPDGIEMLINNKNGMECLDILFSIGVFILEQKGMVRINGEKTTDVEEYVIKFLKHINGSSNTKLIEGIINSKICDDKRKVLISFDEINKDDMKLLIYMAKEAKIFLLAENISKAAVLENYGVHVFDTEKVDVYTAIERVVNE